MQKNLNLIKVFIQILLNFLYYLHALYFQLWGVLQIIGAISEKKIHENDDLRIYRNVYQKLLLRIRRNPSNTKYAREFEIFKDDNNKWRENISKGKYTEKEYIKWLKEQ